MVTGGGKLAALLGVFLFAASASAQAPERSPHPPSRPAQAASVAIDVGTGAETAATPIPAARAGTVAGLSTDPSGTLRRSPVPIPRPAFDSVQLPASMVPQRPATASTSATPSANVTALPPEPAATESQTGESVAIAAIVTDITPHDRPAPSVQAAPYTPASPSVQPPDPSQTAAAPAAPVASGPAAVRPAPRPQGPPAALPQTPIPADNNPGVELPPSPQAQAAVIARPADAANPLAPPRSLRPLRRSPAALSRYTQATRQAAQVTPVAAVEGGTGRVSGGLCGVSTLEGRPLPRIASATTGCGIAEPVSITAVAGVRLSQPTTLDCDTARAFDRWVRQAMQPAFGRGGGGVTQIRIAAHYACRPRNNRAGARVSEHGRGRAIDISGFRLADGQSITVLQDWRGGTHAQALRQMHTSACGIFRTTLGPGSDGHHEDHFHFDLASHRNGSTYCR